MIDGGRGILTRELGRLFGEGALRLNDGQLLERYVSQRDEAAFEALVHRHGPMVLSLCRRYLREPSDVEDAFQATFLVLVRKGPSIRQRQLLSSWLYGVAYKVSMRARSIRRKRQARENGRGRHPGISCRILHLESAEAGQILDQELNRLPEKYRVPLVLCYLNDRTHEQAAAELSWPVGTVRSRLARGRELLRERLTRRGYSPSVAILGLGADLPLRSFTASVPPTLVRATVAAAERFLPTASAGAGSAAGSTILFPSISGSATTLAQGVLTTMALTQMKVIGAGLVAAGMLAGGVGAGAWTLASGPGPQADKPAARSRRQGARQALNSHSRLRFRPFLGRVGRFPDHSASSLQRPGSRARGPAGQPREEARSPARAGSDAEARRSDPAPAECEAQHGRPDSVRSRPRRTQARSRPVPEAPAGGSDPRTLPRTGLSLRTGLYLRRRPPIPGFTPPDVSVPVASAHPPILAPRDEP